MRFNEKQLKEFNELKFKFCERINDFTHGIEFAEEYTNTKVQKKQWLSAVNEALDFTEFLQKDLKEVQIGIAFEEYFTNIEKIFLREFGMIIYPFDNQLSEFKKSVYKDLLDIELEE